MAASLRLGENARQSVDWVNSFTKSSGFQRAEKVPAGQSVVADQKWRRPGEVGGRGNPSTVIIHGRVLFHSDQSQI